MSNGDAASEPWPVRQWELRHGPVLLGTLTEIESEMFRVQCRWEPTPEFAQVQLQFKQLQEASSDFYARVRALSERERKWLEKAYHKKRKKVLALGVTMVATNRASEGLLELDHVGLYINGEEVTFRPSRWANVRSGAPFRRRFPHWLRGRRNIMVCWLQDVRRKARSKARL